MLNLMLAEFLSNNLGIKWSVLIFLIIKIFSIEYCCHPTFPYAHIQLDQANKLLILHDQEQDHAFIYDTLNNEITQLVFLYFVYRLKEKSSRTDITNDDQKAFAFAPTYGYGSTALHHPMISGVVIYYSNPIKVC